MNFTKTTEQSSKYEHLEKCQLPNVININQEEDKQCLLPLKSIAPN
jgi:hypothetical protein